MTKTTALHNEGDSPSDHLLKRVIKRSALIVFGPLYFLFIAFSPLACSGKRGFRGWYWRLVKRACSRLLKLLSIRVETTGADRARIAMDENSIIVINHRSHLDGFALMDAIPDEKWFTFAAKKELCDAALLRIGFRAAGLVEVDRDRGKTALKALADAVRDMPARRSVVLFPEGTRTDGASLGAFKAGAVMVARETGRTILPIVIHGSASLLPRRAFAPKAGVIRIEALPQFVCDPSRSVDEDIARLRTQMTTAFDRGVSDCA